MTSWRDLDEGAACPVAGCTGRLEVVHTLEGGCSCFVSPPCSYCTSTELQCPVCDWTEEDGLPAESDLERFRRYFAANPVLF